MKWCTNCSQIKIFFIDLACVTCDNGIQVEIVWKEVSMDGIT